MLAQGAKSLLIAFARRVAPTQFASASQSESVQTSTQTSPVSRARSPTSDTASGTSVTASQCHLASNGSVQRAYAPAACGTAQIGGTFSAAAGGVRGMDAAMLHQRIRQLEMENARLLMRLSLLLQQTGVDGANDGRKWRHKCGQKLAPVVHGI